MVEIQEVKYERVDDIPLLLGLMSRLRLPEIVDQELGHHGNHQGLSKGQLAMVWIAYILSEGDHRKSYVREWVRTRKEMLEGLLCQSIREEDFSDDRLGIVLKWLSEADSWAAIETRLWSRTMAVYELPLAGVRMDGTTSYGYHSDNEGVMQFGHSKDHRPDLRQLKLMAAAAQPTGQLMGCDVRAGQCADDPLYRPLIERVREMVGRRGLLYSGDSKMAALETRAELVRGEDFYLTPLPLTGKTKALFEGLVSEVVEGEQSVTLLCEEKKLLGYGYEIERELSYPPTKEELEWSERVLVIRSLSSAYRQSNHLDSRLVKAEQALRELTPDPGRGRSQYQDEASLQTAVQEVLNRYKVTDLLQVIWKREETVTERYIGPGRPGPKRPKRIERQIRYVITAVKRDETAIAAQQARFGWKLYATNLPESHTITDCIIHYRGGYCLERGFHLLKDVPLGLSPLYVRTDDQIIGLTHLLTLALRILTLLETQVRHHLAQHKQELSGLYPGQPNRSTDKPTGKRLLQAISRAEITLARIQIGNQVLVHLSPLPDLLLTILAYLGLSASTYTRLTQNST